jgi:hypothetical protein
MKPAGDQQSGRADGAVSTLDVDPRFKRRRNSLHINESTDQVGEPQGLEAVEGRKNR